MILCTITNNFAILSVLGVALAWFFQPLFTWMTDGSIRSPGGGGGISPIAMTRPTASFHVATNG